jgi:predicted secreted protein
MAQAGKSSLVKVSTVAGGAGAYNTVAGVKSASMNQSGQNLDITVLPASFVARLQGLKDASYSLSGNWESTDTNGQIAIRNAWLNDTVLWIQFLPDGSTGFKQEVKVSAFNLETSVEGITSFSIELEGTGAIAAV